MTERTDKMHPETDVARLNRLAAMTHLRYAPASDEFDTVGAGAPSPIREAGWIRSSYRTLTTRGLSEREAGNLVAYAAGLGACRRGWTIAEVEHLVMLKFLVSSGRVSS